jgi:hypothetical protein
MNLLRTPHGAPVQLSAGCHNQRYHSTSCQASTARSVLESEGGMRETYAPAFLQATLIAGNRSAGLDFAGHPRPITVHCNEYVTASQCN